MIELHSWITAIIYPLINGTAATLLLIAYFKNNRVTALAFLGSASLLSFVISVIWLVLRYQNALSITIVPAYVARVLWVVQAAVEYMSIAFYITGVYQLMRYFTTKPQLASYTKQP